MVGVEDEQQVQRLRGNFIYLIGLCRHGEEHVQQVLCVIQVVARVHERLTNVQLVSRSSNCRELREYSMRKNIAMVWIRGVHLVVVVRGHRTDNRRQHGHRVGVVTKALEEVQHALVEHRMCADSPIERGKLISRRQFAMQQ